MQKRVLILHLIDIGVLSCCSTKETFIDGYAAVYSANIPLIFGTAGGLGLGTR